MSVYGKHVIVGKLKESIVKQAEVNLPCFDVLLYSGAIRHMKKKHKESLKYLDKIPAIVENPDYIGKHPEEENSIELIKVFEDNMLLAIKLAEDGYLYISNMYRITDSKLKHRINSGRLKVYVNSN